MDILVVQGKDSEAQAVMESYVKAIHAANAEAGKRVNHVLRQYFYYSKGDFAALEKAALEDKDGTGQLTLFHALTELGRMEEAAKVEPGEGLDPFDLLAVSLAWEQAGNTAEAARWRTKGIQLLKEGNSDEVSAGKLMESNSAPGLGAVDEIGLQASRKSILLTVLGRQHPSMKAELFARARQLNVMRTFPHHLLARTLGQ
jgi:hypothetical protein